MAALARSSDQPAKKTCCCAERRKAMPGLSRQSEHHGHDQHHVGHSHGAGCAPTNDNAVRDPVCGMVVDPHTTQHRYNTKGGRTTSAQMAAEKNLSLTRRST